MTGVRTLAALPLARPNIVGTFGVSASTHWIASSTAQSVLERGGNAFDAATAAGFVLHLVEPHLNGPAGDLVAVIAPIGAAPRVLCGQGTAPRRASIEHFRSEGLDAVPGSGALAAAVPGAVDAWLLLLRDHGTWRLEDVLAYAIDYAEHGHPLLPAAAAVIGQVAELFLQDWTTSATHWLRDGVPPAPGEMITNPTYAATLRRLVRESTPLHSGSSPPSGSSSVAEQERRAAIDAARRTWASGFVAEAVERFVRDVPHRHSTGSRHRGVLTAADMAEYSAHFEPTVSSVFRGSTIHKAGAWTQGPVLLQALQILGTFDDDDIDVNLPLGVHRVVESMKLAMADREAYYGDNAHDNVLPTLLSADYAQGRRDLIGRAASHEMRPGRAPWLPAAYRPTLSTGGADESGAVGEPTVRASGEMRGDTCHIDVVDRWGNAISATPSGGWLQSSPVIPELGFSLGTRLQMTHLDPRSPSALMPGRRPRTTLTPTIVMRDRAVTALGSPGGDQQDQWQLVHLLRTLVNGQAAQEAIEAPMFHTSSFPGSFWPRTWDPGGLVIEDRVGESMLASLSAMGHEIRRAGPWSLGRLSSVHVDLTTGRISGAANPRGAQGYAVGR